MKLVWSAVLILGCAVPALAADGDEKKPAAPAIDGLDRIERLERELQQLKAGLPKSMTLEVQDKKDGSKEASKSEMEFKATFTDGFRIKSTDGNFELHVGGRWEEEYRYTFNRYSDGALRTSTNTFYAREAFLSLDGTLWHDWGFKVNGDFSPPQTQSVAAVPANVSTGAIIEEAWVEWKSFKEFRLLFGSFKQPCSFEITDSPRFSELIQRSPLARFQPNFDTGIKAYGSFWDTLLTYEFAVTNGRSHLANQGRDNNDDNDGKEIAARLTVAPFVQDKESFLKGLRIGVYGTVAHIGENAGINPVGWPGNVATNELAVTYLQFTAPAGTRFVGDRYRLGAEFTYAVGPFMMRGEVMERHDEVFIGTTYNNLLATMGYYGEVTYVLTGEDRIPNARIVPKNPFNLSEGGWGAFELAARFGCVSLDRQILNDLATNFAQNSNRASSITVGVNWWLTQNVKICLDYMGENYYQGVQLSGTHHGSHVHGMLARFQVDF